MRKTFRAAVFCVALVSSLSFSVDHPSAPVGFTWQEVPELKAAFLKPEGWFFKQEEQKGTLAYFITKESIATGGEFKTGLSLNVFRRLKKSKAVDQAQYLIGNAISKHHVEPFQRRVGPFYQLGCELKDTDATGTIVMREIAMANEKTNTLYLFIFESPESEWPAASKIGEKMLDQLVLDDEI